MDHGALPSPSDKPPRQAWYRLAALTLVVAALGLPINDLWRFALLVVAAVAILRGTISTRSSRWLGAAATVGLCSLAGVWLAAPRIDEGHNVFLVDGPGRALEAGLPGEAFRLMAAEFDARYPPERRCDPKVDGCWRGQGFPDAPFAFSADAILHPAPWSRRVRGIDATDPVWLRLGFINELRYNWNALVSDIDRASRNRSSLALVHRWQLTMPWFVAYRFSAAFVGSELCWRGKVLWEGANETFTTISHADMQCRTLVSDDVGRRILGVAIAQPLAMHLRSNGTVRLRQWTETGLMMLAWCAVLFLLVRCRLRRLVLPGALITVALVVIFLNDASFIGGVRPFDSGDDGLVYDGYARTMLRKLLAGDVAGALEGVEPVFYFTPGMRYLRALEHIVFGESYLGYLALMLLLPFLVLALLRRFLPRDWALIAAVIFVAIPVGVLFGSSYVQYVKWAARGFADPAAYAFFLAGLVLLVGRTPAGPGNRFGTAAGSGALFALALFVRPNLAPAAGILLGGAGLAALWQGAFRRLAGLCGGFLPVLGMALHNWVYGGVLVLFTTTAGLAMSMPPAAYLSALGEFARGNLVGEHVVRALHQLGAWLAGPSELAMMAPFGLAAIAILIRVAIWRGADPWLRLVAGATTVQHGVGLFFLPPGRYYYLTWLLTLLVVLVWLRGEGLPLLRRKFPAIADHITRHPARLATSRAVARVSSLAT